MGTAQQSMLDSIQIPLRHFHNFCTCIPFFFDPRVFPFVKKIEKKAEGKFEATFWKMDIRKGIFSKYTKNPNYLQLKIALENGLMKIEDYELIVSQDFPILVTENGHDVFILAMMWIPYKYSTMKVTYIRYNEAPSMKTKWRDGVPMEFKCSLPMKNGDFSKILRKFGLKAIPLKNVLVALSKSEKQNIMRDCYF